MVAGVGNSGFELTDGSEPCKNQEVLDTIIPYFPCPAAYPNVIGVSASDSNDVWAGGRQYNFGFEFIDVAAPGIDLKLVSPNNSYYVDSGTSFAGPHVSALTGLILSVASLPISAITDIIQKTALDLGSPGVDDYWGYGRINAYQALLLAHAYSNKSVSSTATASNNGRHLVKSNDGYYHLVFESGITSGGNVLSEIFYRKSPNGSTNWRAPIRLSAGNEQNRYPSIAVRSVSSDTTGQRLYVVWQRKTGTNTYDILFRHFNGSSWETIRTITSGVSLTSDPLPVIAISTPASSFEMIVVYRTSSGLNSRRSTSTNGSSWDAEVPVTSSTSAGNPSATYSPNDYANFDCAWNTNGSSGKIYHRHFYTSNWGNEVIISSGLGSSANTHEYPSYARGSTNNRHIVWQATDATQGNRKVIFHNLNLNTTQFTKFYSSSTNYLRPSISGFESGGALVFWHDQSSAKNIRYARFNGAYWETSSAGIVYGTNGVEASAALMNPPATPIRAVWRSAGSSPYSLSLGVSLSRSNALEIIAYSRQLIYAQEDGPALAVRLFAPHITGEDSVLQFPAVANGDSLEAGSLAEKLTFDFVVPANADTVKLDVEVYTKDAANLLQSGASTLQVGFELIDVTQNRPAGRGVTVANVALSGEQIFARSVSLPLAALRGAWVRIRPVFAGLDLGKARGALVHEYGAYEAGSEPAAEKATTATASSPQLAVAIQPNPFNSSTRIHFTLPTADEVRLRIYNLQGQLVRELVHEQRAAGAHTVTWDGRDDRGVASASGIYFMRFQTGSNVKVSKLTLVR